MTYPSYPTDPMSQHSPDYYSRDPDDKARSLIKLAVIFNYISAGLDGLFLLFAIGLSVAILFIPDAARSPDDPPRWVLATIYLAMGIFVLPVSVVKIIGTRKLQTSARNAWGWGLAVGIVGTAQIVCGSCCWLQVAPGIYTIVIMCLENVRSYLARQANASAYPQAGA